MNILCYGQPRAEKFFQAWERVWEAYPELGFECHRSLGSFTARLRQPGRNIALVMLYLPGREILPDLPAIQPLLNGMPLVVLLDDQGPEVLRKAHELRPRVILYSYWPVEELSSVLIRCIHNCGVREDEWRFQQEHFRRVAGKGDGKGCQGHG